jgi:hypothetical protein
MPVSVVFTPKTMPTGIRLQQKLRTIAPHGQLRINWTGSPLGEDALNHNAFTNKLRQLEVLKECDVLTPDFSPAGGPFPTYPPHPGWMPRTSTHRKGRDFNAAGKMSVDFWVEPLALTEEKRLHVIRRPKGTYVVFRTAKKVPIEGTPTHPWVRSHDLGWRFSYAGGSSERERAAAVSAIRALRLDFGAVDLGTFCGHPVVLEVNTCPGLEDTGNTLHAYASEFAKHVGGHGNDVFR